MGRGILIAPFSRAVLQERVLFLSNSVMISNDLPCEIHINKTVCNSSTKSSMSNTLLVESAGGYQGLS
jgi:hypothetical protein